ncbi:nitroreductase family protein (plasmid) [Rhizobium sp. CB3171]|uniref:nitroreductase family protein n=1 Tax=Rhizobium sp. CB3171 TaxID=3039157 RepID=UPI0024B0932D|nr:nitroreductase family protein [Rhizobium sp. CB3171]WFU07170.1 nitroreductase family protein [Rhizobium sp. CB3171]
MDVYEAVTSRRSVRGFKEKPVAREILERVPSAAARSPSGSNIQPWNTYVMTGAALAELKTALLQKALTQQSGSKMPNCRKLSRFSQMLAEECEYRGIELPVKCGAIKVRRVYTDCRHSFCQCCRTRRQKVEML